MDYLAAVIDLYARQVVGWVFSAILDADLVIKALDMAHEQRGRPQNVLLYSDQGRQYGSRSFRQRIWRCRFTQSMGRRGKCHDNTPMERLFRSLKTEWIPTVGYMSTALAKQDIGRFPMEQYNSRRTHQFNEGLAPAVAEEKLTKCPGSVDHYTPQAPHRLIRWTEHRGPITAGVTFLPISFSQIHPMLGVPRQPGILV